MEHWKQYRMFPIDRISSEETAIVLFSGSFGNASKETRYVTL